MARFTLILAAVVEIVFRGIPALVGTPGVARLFNLEFPWESIMYVHAFGAVMLCLGVLFYIASKDPQAHLLIVNIALLRFALGIAAQFASFLQLGSLQMFGWIHMAVDVVLVILLILARSSVKAGLVGAAEE